MSIPINVIRQKRWGFRGGSLVLYKFSETHFDELKKIYMLNPNRYPNKFPMVLKVKIN
jgi:hypothetical protein